MSLETRARAATQGLRAATAVDTEAGLAQLRRTHRRRSATRAAAAAVAVAATIVGGAALVGDRDTAQPAPAAPPSSTASSPEPSAAPLHRIPGGPQVALIPDARSRPVMVDPEITTDVTPGEKLLDSSSTSDPAYNGDGSIELTVGNTGLRQLRVEGSCADAPEAWYVMTVEPNATYIDTGRCDGAVVKVGGNDYHEEYSGKTLGIFVTDQNPRAFRRCFEYSPPEGCDDLERPLRGTGATMRLATYEWHQGPTAVRMFGQPFPARDNFLDRTWSLTRAAAAETGARTLSFDVDASPHERIAQVVYVVRDEACSRIDLCFDGRALDAHPSLPTAELSIDGELADEPPHEGPFFTRATDATWGELPIGPAHDIAVHLVGGDPTTVDVGVLVYEAD